MQLHYSCMRNNNRRIFKAMGPDTGVDAIAQNTCGENIAKFEGAVVLNEVSAMLYKLLEKSASREDLLTDMLNQYDVDEETASTDLDEILETFEQIGLLEK